MKTFLRHSVYALVVLFPIAAYAGAMDVLDSGLRSAVQNVTATLEATAIQWLSSFILLQFLITQLGLLKSGADLEAIWAKVLGSLLWFAFCFYVMGNATGDAGFIATVSRGFFAKAENIAGGAAFFNAAFIIDHGAGLAGRLLGKINSASGITDVFMPSIIGGLLGCVILATAAFIAFKVFLIKLETILIIMMAPLSFAFLGLNAMKDQGIAPFKALVSLLYRVILLAVILKTMDVMSDNLIDVINQITSDSIDGIWSVLFAAVMGYLLLAFLAYKSDSIAASLASGSTQLGTNDVASAAAMGAALGGALGGAGGALAGAGAKPVQGMMDWMKQTGSGAGGTSISNAAMEGAGGLNAPLAKPEVPNMSMAGKGTGGGAGASSGSGGSAQTGSNSNKSGGAATQASNGRANAAGAVSKAGGSPQAAKAAGDAAAAGKSSGDIAAAAWGAGGTPAQGTAAAVADALGSAGAGEQTIVAGVEAAAAGGSPDQIASAVEQAALSDIGVSGQDPGRFADTAASAASAARLPGVGSSSNPATEGLRRDPERDAAREARREAALAKKGGGSGASAGIGGGSPMEQQLGDLVNAMTNPKGKTLSDRVGELNQHIAQEGAATHVSINTHQE